MNENEWSSKKLPEYCAKHGGARIIGFVNGVGVCEYCVDMGDDYSEQRDDICITCDSTGEVDGRVCKSCQGKGYVQPPSSK